MRAVIKAALCFPGCGAVTPVCVLLGFRVPWHAWGLGSCSARLRLVPYTPCFLHDCCVLGINCGDCSRRTKHRQNGNGLWGPAAAAAHRGIGGTLSIYRRARKIREENVLSLWMDLYPPRPPALASQQVGPW